MKRKIEETLSKRLFKDECLALAGWIGNDSEKFDALYQIFSSHPEQALQDQAIWVMRFCIESYPTLLQKHFSAFLEKLESGNASPAVKRNGFAVLNAAEIPEEKEGQMMHMCFSMLEDSHEKVAAQVFALRILHKLSKNYPEIISEIEMILHQNQYLKLPAMKACVKNIFPQFLH